MVDLPVHLALSQAVTYAKLTSSGAGSISSKLACNREDHAAATCPATEAVLRHIMQQSAFSPSSPPANFRAFSLRPFTSALHPITMSKPDAVSNRGRFPSSPFNAKAHILGIMAFSHLFRKRFQDLLVSRQPVIFDLDWEVWSWVETCKRRIWKRIPILNMFSGITPQKTKTKFLDTRSNQFTKIFQFRRRPVVFKLQ
jgi:hypothetical protein